MGTGQEGRGGQHLLGSCQEDPESKDEEGRCNKWMVTEEIDPRVESHVWFWFLRSSFREEFEAPSSLKLPDSVPVDGYDSAGHTHSIAHWKGALISGTAVGEGETLVALVEAPPFGRLARERIGGWHG